MDGDRTVREVMPFWAALGKDPLVIDEAVVTAMGVLEIGPLRSPREIARVLSETRALPGGASPPLDPFDVASDAFLSAHYPLRLGCDVFCPKCKARNTVDAPAVRELSPSDEGATSLEAQHEHLAGGVGGGGADQPGVRALGQEPDAVLGRVPHHARDVFGAAGPHHGQGRALPVAPALLVPLELVRLGDDGVFAERAPEGGGHGRAIGARHVRGGSGHAGMSMCLLLSG